MKSRFKVFIAVFAMAVSFGRFLYGGFFYPLMLDDYLQYYVYPNFSLSITRLIKEQGMLASRPLAGPSDLFIWSRFFPDMLTAVLILSVMFASSGLIFYYVLNRHMKITPVFLIFYLLFPTNIEGTYWISASSRVVTGMFFAALFFLCMDKCLRGWKWRWFAPSCIFQLISMCYYEQYIILSVVLSLFLIILHKPKLSHWTAYAAASFLNAAAYFIFTASVGYSLTYTKRSELADIRGAYFWSSHLPRVKAQFGSLLRSSSALLKKGFFRGLEIIVREKWIFSVVFIILAGVAVFFIAARKSENKKTTAYPCRIAASVVLFAAPLSIFILIVNPWVSLRVTVASSVGAALGADTLFAAVLNLTEKIKAKNITNILSASVSSALCVWFLTCAASEVHDYKQAYRDDQRIINALLETAEKFDRTVSITALGIEKSYLEDVNFTHNEHMHGATESSWALTNAVKTYSSDGNTPEIIPIPAKSAVWKPERLEGSAAVFIFDETERLTEVGYVKTESGYIFYGSDDKSRETPLAEIQIDGGGDSRLKIYLKPTS